MPFPRARTQTIDCTCTPPRPHGTRHGYHQHDCGCDPCLHASRAQQAQWRRLRADGGPIQVPVTEVRHHIEILCAAGLNMSEIARRAGYSRQLVHKLRYRNTVVDRFIAADFLAVRAS